jgi:DNA-binding cell septation regulator SpoVG
MSNVIRIKNIRKSASDKILAMFDIEFTALGLTIYGAKILPGNLGTWLAMPSFMELIDGEKKYFPAISLPKELMKTASDRALALFREMSSQSKNEQELDEITF